MRIVFFSHHHRGDIHTGRSFVRLIMQKVKEQYPETTFTYSHPNPFNLLSDIPNLGYDPLAYKNVDQYANLIRLGDDVYVNTWYCQQGLKYFRKYGLTIDSLYEAFDDTCKKLWEFSLSDISTEVSDFFPAIDYSKFEIEETQRWLEEHPAPKILIENGAAASNQAVNFDMAPIIAELAKKHMDKIFILSKGANIKLPDNVVYTSNIIKKKNKQFSDLNEISFLSTHCDTIIGRASGVWTFALTQENLFKRKVKFIGFVKPIVMPKKPEQFWLSTMLQDKVKYSADILASTETSPNKVLEIIEKNL
jgi:hypothetical protein